MMARHKMRVKRVGVFTTSRKTYDPRGTASYVGSEFLLPNPCPDELRLSKRIDAPLMQHNQASTELDTSRGEGFYTRARLRLTQKPTSEAGERCVEAAYRKIILFFGLFSIYIVL
jgi:hypothetical protein